jgi:hypothetical protein
VRIILNNSTTKSLAYPATMTPLSEAEKREIVRLFRKLHAAIIHSRPDVDVKFKAFETAYRGNLHSYISQFGKALSKTQWVGQLGIYLLDEIDEATFWKLPRPDEILPERE